jgi:hypothetical protein
MQVSGSFGRYIYCDNVRQSFLKLPWRVYRAASHNSFEQSQISRTILIEENGKVCAVPHPFPKAATGTSSFRSRITDYSARDQFSVYATMVETNGIVFNQ